MSERWSLWTRNVIDKYKDWSVEDIKKDLQKNANPFSVCMEHWQGDFNISTMIRNANAFNAKEVFYLGKKRWDRRGAVGSHHYINLQHLNTYEELSELKNKYVFVAIDNNLPNTQKLNEFDWSLLEKPPMMIFGEEGVGLTNDVLELADQVVEIPQAGSVRSLNVGTCSGILMYDYVAKIKNSKDLYKLPIKRCGGSDNVQSESSQLILL
jgi:tRNA G18 (ribose-2'-O)-methylase SpoU